ncbi:MAG: bifunctional lysine-specific demethylase and histidyl-hydroxylase [Sphingomonadales bacterium]|jgi:mannose-6-phosphate isomerase-like protein (cupin superfamily)|nr:bifunctional lysine-specific demethylase and histidyl-hydroxylase [Sphingomonadales bacterium]
MNIEEAETIMKSVLEPLPLETFFQALGRSVFDVPGGPAHSRAGLFGEDPVRTALSAHPTHAERLDCHAVSPAAPPPSPRKVDGEAGFRDLIRAYHDRDYTVRMPEVIALSPPLQRLTRALEILLHQPVDASLFWSKSGAGAIVHYDNRDNLVVQLKGRKRWYVSTDPPGLQNNWRHVGEPLPHLQRRRAIDVGPGDLLYIPRGTPHTVESLSESLHLAVLFVPTTLREVLIAALDHVSDQDRFFRETAVARAEDGLDGLPVHVERGLERLIARCRSGGFVEAAMKHRSSRFVSGLPALRRPDEVASLSAETLVRHSPLAIVHLRQAGDLIDFACPGDHIAIHPGVEAELRFIRDKAEFRIRDIPGASSIEVRIALIGRLIAAGVLEPVTAEGRADPGSRA